MLLRPRAYQVNVVKRLTLAIVLILSVWQKTPDFQSVDGIERAFVRFRTLDWVAWCGSEVVGVLDWGA